MFWCNVFTQDEIKHNIVIDQCHGKSHWLVSRILFYNVDTVFTFLSQIMQQYICSNAKIEYDSLKSIFSSINCECDVYCIMQSLILV